MVTLAGALKFTLTLSSGIPTLWRSKLYGQWKESMVGGGAVSWAGWCGGAVSWTGGCGGTVRWAGGWPGGLVCVICHFCQTWIEQQTKIGRTALLVSNSTPGYTVKPGLVLFATMYTSCHLLWRVSCRHSLVPRPSTHLQFLIVFSMQNNQKLVVYVEGRERGYMHAVIAD